MKSYFIYSEKKDIENKIDFKYLDSVADNFKYLKKGSLERDLLFKNIFNSINYLPKPKSNVKKSILMVGKVQSGKTTHFSCLSAATIDIGYDFIIVLGGTNLTLLSQNINRARETFKDESIVIFTQDNTNNLNPEVVDRYIKMGLKIIFCIMKESSNLKKIINVFRGSSLYNRSVAIIDDEGDLASLSNNTNIKTINNLIGSLYNDLFSTVVYVSYTATPYANFFISKDSWQYPDYINLINVNENLYCGLEAFHNSKFGNIKKADDNLTNLDIAITEAIMKYLVAITFNPNFHYLEVVIHSARINENQEVIYDIVKGLIKKKLKCEYNYFIDNNYYLVEKYCSKDELLANRKEKIKKLLSNIKILKLYGESNKKLNDEDIDKGSLLIYVGGDMLGRGVSFVPVVTYLTRTSKIFFMDTLLQRARWFGYRKNDKLILDNTLFDFMSIYIEDRIKKAYESIRKTEKALWKTIEVLNDFGFSCKNVSIPLISNNKDLLPTNHDKMGKQKKPIIISNSKIYSFKSINSYYYNKIVSIESLIYSLNFDIENITEILEFVSISSFLEKDLVSIDKDGMIKIDIYGEIYLYESL